jgi:hypothetical protein
MDRMQTGHTGRGARRPVHDPVEANARLTSGTAVVLLVLLAAEGVTILRIRGLISVHVFIGMLLVPPVLVKTCSTVYRFARYYLGADEFREKGPPPVLLRMLGPFVVLLTFAVLASGIALVFVGAALRSQMLFLHKASFLLWLAAMTVHVLGHLLDTARVAPRDWVHRTRRSVTGAGLRQWTIAASLVVGLLLGLLVLGRVAPWQGSAPYRGRSSIPSAGR